MQPKDKLELMHFDVPIAQLDIYETDQPWFHCNFIPAKNFDEHQSFFKEFQERYSSGEEIGRASCRERV